jgi:hypothetical protein
MTNTVASNDTINYEIYIAGDFEVAKNICRKYCNDIPFCVNISKVDYIYTGGEEQGIRVGLINYPRFPMTKDTLKQHAHDIANTLMLGLYQHSYTIVGPDNTEWFSRRKT